MKLDYDKKLSDTENAKLKVLEEQFFFDSQIKIKTELNESKEKFFTEFELKTKEELNVKN